MDAEDLPPLEELKIAGVSDRAPEPVESSLERNAAHRLVCDRLSAVSDDDEDDGDDWEEEPMPVDEVTCLFCQMRAIAGIIVDHIKSDHRVDLKDFTQRHKMPVEEIIRFVNYLRKENISPTQFQQNGLLDSALWESEAFMIPQMEGDYNMVSELSWDWNEPDEEPEPFPEPAGLNDLRTVLNGGSDADHSVLIKKAIQDAGDERNEDYFASYSGYNIHCEMLRDHVRTESYRKAITECVKDKVVLDLGCGSGVLSCFAAKAGAKKVFAVDKAEIINDARAIARDNGVSETIEFIHGDLDSVRLNSVKVDVLVSEWMGYFLLFEQMLDSVLDARDRYLKPNGSMIPDASSMFVVPVSDMDAWKNAVGFWENAYGLKFSAFRNHNLSSPAVEVVNPECLISDPVLLRSFDLLRCTAVDTVFDLETTFVPNKSGPITALAGYFDVSFTKPDGSKELMFNTSPKDTPTHWAQSVFYLDEPFNVDAGHPVKIYVTVSRSAKDTRGLSVLFRLNGLEGKSWERKYEM